MLLQASAAACCASCNAETKCNVWVWCGGINGCSGGGTYQECWLKHSEDLDIMKPRADRKAGVTHFLNFEANMQSSRQANLNFFNAMHQNNSWYERHCQSESYSALRIFDQQSTFQSTGMSKTLNPTWLGSAEVVSVYSHAYVIVGVT